MNMAKIKFSREVANMENGYSKPVLEIDFHTWITAYKKNKQTKENKQRNKINQKCSQLTNEKLFPTEIQLVYLLPTGQPRKKSKINERKQSKQWESYKKNVDILFPKFILISIC